MKLIQYFILIFVLNYLLNFKSLIYSKNDFQTWYPETKELIGIVIFIIAKSKIHPGVMAAHMDRLIKAQLKEVHDNRQDQL